MEQRGKGGEEREGGRESEAVSKECGIGWLGKGSFGPYKVTLLQAHNAGKLLPPQI